MREKLDQEREIMDLRAHLLHPDYTRIVDKTELGNIPTECPDGRNADTALFEFGGDLAAKIRMVRAVEMTLGVEFSPAEIKGHIKTLIEKSGRTYFHIDEHFVHAMADALGMHGQETAVEALLEEPTDEEQEKIKSALQTIAAKNFGCGHLGLMNDKPEEFGLRDGFLLAAYEAALETMWEDAKDQSRIGSTERVRMHLMHGEHEEKAIVLVSSKIEGKLVLTTPNIDGEEYFIATPEVAATLQDQSTGLVSQVWEEIDERAYLVALRELSQKQDGATLALLGAAQGKNIYSAEYFKNDEGDLDVFVTYVGVNGKAA